MLSHHDIPCWYHLDIYVAVALMPHLVSSWSVLGDHWSRYLSVYTEPVITINISHYWPVRLATNASQCFHIVLIAGMDSVWYHWQLYSLLGHFMLPSNFVWPFSNFNNSMGTWVSWDIGCLCPKRLLTLLWPHKARLYSLLWWFMVDQNYVQLIVMNN